MEAGGSTNCIVLTRLEIYGLSTLSTDPIHIHIHIHIHVYHHGISVEM